jgi:broad specificity phosphatase PhoE
MATTIFLIRHGKTAANLQNRFAGRTAEPLHQSGCEQIGEVGVRLKQLGVSALYAGPLPRTRQSAEIIGAITGVGVRQSEAFNEINIPHWDGLTKEEITARFGLEYPTWLAAPEKFNLPNCETISQVQERAVGGLEEIFAERAGETIAVVSHLIVIRSLILHYQHRPISEFRGVKIDNGSLVRLSRGADRRTEIILGL